MSRKSEYIKKYKLDDVYSIFPRKDTKYFLNKIYQIAPSLFDFKV